MKVLLCLVVAFAVHTVPQLTKDSFDQWYDFIGPSEQELAYLKINWKISIQEGLLEAKRVKKPIMFWAMNGRPIRGCT